MGLSREQRKLKTLRLTNRNSQRAYRERHADELRAARRVVPALMRLRARMPKWHGFRDRLLTRDIGNVAEALAEFLRADELKLLVEALKAQAETTPEMKAKAREDGERRLQETMCALVGLVNTQKGRK